MTYHSEKIAHPLKGREVRVFLTDEGERHRNHTTGIRSILVGIYPSHIVLRDIDDDGEHWYTVIPWRRIVEMDAIIRGTRD